MECKLNELVSNKCHILPTNAIFANNNNNNCSHEIDFFAFAFYRVTLQFERRKLKICTRYSVLAQIHQLQKPHTHTHQNPQIYYNVVERQTYRIYAVGNQSKRCAVKIDGNHSICSILSEY